MIIIDNPYGELSNGFWVKGNLHSHSTRSDGSRKPQEVIDDYARHGYDFLALSDHDTLNDEAFLASLDARGLILVPANEISANGPHMLHIGARTLVPPDPSRQVVIDTVAREGGFTVMNHPNWFASYDHCSFKNLIDWNGYRGIEIFNGVVVSLEGSAYATIKWDRVLSAGRRVWGFANDDSHAPEHDQLAWNVAYVRERTPAAVVAALEQGAFYASTGVVIDNIAVTGDRIAISAKGAGRISAYMHDGKRFAFADAPSLEVAVPADARYARFECWGNGEQVAWTQPFFVREAP
ncbi:MAG: CehA/McbA family metallohydrolase [Capsulimonadaceae bacterium]|nr:CehA/McbA family metallohydrolase [Capsulimonadaceae bacterium]